MSTVGLSKNGGVCSGTTARLEGPPSGNGAKAMSFSNSSSMSPWREEKRKGSGISIALLRDFIWTRLWDQERSQT